MVNQLKDTVKACKCAKCQIKKRATDIRANIEEFMRKEMEHDGDTRIWRISDILRVPRANSPFYFVKMKTPCSSQTCSDCESGMWEEITCVIQESPATYNLSLATFVDILSEAKRQEGQKD